MCTIRLNTSTETEIENKICENSKIDIFHSYSKTVLPCYCYSSK